MRLQSIDAVRFGRIDGRSITGISPRLTVVLGPNEAGKSSFTALVRYVLYGFPTAAAAEAPYLSAGGGKREGRLAFVDDDQTWTIERVEGVRGGPVLVKGADGSRHDTLVSELTEGVSSPAYRVVFGFGLGDLAQIAELKGRDDDLIAALYAAGAGLGGVNLADVRKAFAASADELWKKGGSAPRLNKAKSDREQVRADVRTLEADAEALRMQATRLDVALTELETARSYRAETRAAADRVTRAVAEAERLYAEAAEQTRLASESARAADDCGQRANLVVVDPVALDAADAIDAIAEDLSGFRALAEAAASEQTKLAGLDTRMRTALAETGWTEEQALAAASDAGCAAEIEGFRDAVTKARARAELAASASDAARAADAADAAPASAGRSKSWLVPGIVIAVIGLGAAAYGLIGAQLPLTIVGAMLVLVGALFALFGRGPALGPQPRSGSRVAASDAELGAAQAALSSVLDAWGAWVEAKRLGSGADDPAAVAARYAAARAAREIAAERAEAHLTLARARERVTAYAQRAAGVCTPVLGESVDPSALDRIAEIVSRARARVADARVAAQTAGQLASESEQHARDAAASAASADELTSRAAQVLSDIAGAPDLDAARTAEIRALDVARDASDAADLLAEEVARLTERVGAERREDALAELRLTETRLTETIARGMGEYAVSALASRLLAEAQERFERDRQPGVVRHAEQAFVSMTNGRYRRVVVPLGRDAIEVFDARGDAYTPGRLSRGTAEQLYLALRIGLIDQMGEVGSSLPVLMDDILVNFSPERAEPAARAIADLARRRQVIFFTCHPATADLLCGVDADAVRVELETTP